MQLLALTWAKQGLCSPQISFHLGSKQAQVVSPATPGIPIPVQIDSGKGLDPLGNLRSSFEGVPRDSEPCLVETPETDLGTSEREGSLAD